MACQHFPDDQTLWLQAGAGEDDVIHLPSGLDRVDCERQEEEEDHNNDNNNDRTDKRNLRLFFHNFQRNLTFFTSSLGPE